MARRFSRGKSKKPNKNSSPSGGLTAGKRHNWLLRGHYARSNAFILMYHSSLQFMHFTVTKHLT